VTVMRAVTGTLPALMLLTLALGCGTGDPSPGTSQTPPSETATGTTSSASGTASATPTTALPPAPRRLTPEADGSHYSMTLGSTTAVVVRGQDVDEPQVDGTSVILVPVLNVTDSGVREWEVRAVEVGTSRVTSGTPAYTITLTVG
jgi:hypothetical protein